MKRQLRLLIEELENFELNAGQYYSDSEYTSLIDSILLGKLRGLRFYIQQMGLSDLSESISDLDPEIGGAITVLETLRHHVLQEIKIRARTASKIDQSFWGLVHPLVKNVAKRKFLDGHYADAVESAFKEINNIVKSQIPQRQLQSGGRELDGARLMRTAFSPNNPVIRLSSLNNESERNIQEGYMEIFAGAMIGIRNPKAHANLTIDAKRAMHLIMLSSLLVYKLEEAGLVL